jgi:hypothetical protein
METLKLKAIRPVLLGEIKIAVIAHHTVMAEKKSHFIFKNNARHQVTGHLNLAAFHSPVIVKAFVINRWKSSIPSCLYPDPAFKGYDMALKVQQLSPSTPKVYGYASDKRFFKAGMSYLIMTWMLGWIRFDQVLRESSQQKDIYLEYWERYFLFLRSRAEKGIHHRDMKPGNVLFKKDSETFCFIDLEDIRLFNGPNDAFIQKHFSSIQTWLLSTNLDPQLFMEVQNLYKNTVCNHFASKH